ncbi:hypothetical protein PYW07_010358 [Mythimna separata]|uniref:Uncharacterized protein n=1 Tax=Mythimna separata TaxID=271217 RepID=A0AAD7YA17_MYTSE|nr:hypothetical protein PYW07_010358 [Mythimna separata]
MLRECVLLVSVCVFGVGSLSGRGFFCRDPDTGKLHPANSTWTATTFCGKYHCKLKRKNITAAQYAPLRQINITDIQLLGQNLTTIDVQKKEVFVKKDEAQNKVVSTENKTELDAIASIDNNNSSKDQGITLEDIINDKNGVDKDRYLSDEEIKSLTQVLHTLKKGDLEAIVEIYNLAQDIYKELDRATTEHALNEAITNTETLNKGILKSDLFKKIAKHNHASYWYEPLFTGKIRSGELLRPDVVRTDINPEIPPLAIGLQVPAPVNVPKPTPSSLLGQKSFNLSPIPVYQIRRLSDSFFNGPLSHKDFGKLPYYYPMSNFQRMSSYKHEQKPNIKVMVNAVTPNTVPIPLLPIVTTTSDPILVNKVDTNKSIVTKYNKDLSPTIFLPYPFINMQHHNWSLPQSIYHKNKLDMRRKESLFDKLDLLGKDKYTVDQIGKRRPLENNLDRLELITKDENLFNEIQIGTRRKDDKIGDLIEMRKKEENIGDQLRMHRKGEHIDDQLEMQRKEEKNDDQLRMYRKEEKIGNQLGMRRRQDNILNKLEFLTKETTAKLSGILDPRRKGDINNKNTITIKHNEQKSEGKKSNAILMNPDLENFEDLQVRPSKTKENMVNTNVKQEGEEKGRRLIERRRPEWLTDSLPQQIIDEVRAHIQEKQRLFIHPVPLRKKVKLERVAKLLNLDTIKRSKRAVDEDRPTDEQNEIKDSSPLESELYEVYIESTTCNADYTIPGYFRYGNLTQPFPECCPQRIPTR